ncbi:DeoR family transcriptional regulator [Streptomyces sp. M41]|uniref:DeoR family transcriptional regulator n=1 Tax=Streptomyces sp. M41 TaxID=3059412 RepID=UPI00374DDCBB
MQAERRHRLILRALRADGPAAVTHLSERLGVSPATIRRDLVELEEDGLLTGNLVVHSELADDEGIELVLLADAAQFPGTGTGTAQVCGPRELDVVVTNAPVGTASPASLGEAGVEVVVAGEVQA